jgi:hypothetical protein
MSYLYSLSREERKELGKAGREWATSEEAGFTSEYMGKRVINAIDKLFNTWTPRQKFEIIDVLEEEDPELNHALMY